MRTERHGNGSAKSRNTAHPSKGSFSDGSGSEDMVTTAREAEVARLFHDVDLTTFRNPAYDGPMGIFEGYGERDDMESPHVSPLPSTARRAGRG